MPQLDEIGKTALSVETAGRDTYLSLCDFGRVALDAVDEVDE
jgi:hypothetical protein